MTRRKQPLIGGSIMVVLLAAMGTGRLISRDQAGFKQPIATPIRSLPSESSPVVAIPVLAIPPSDEADPEDAEREGLTTGEIGYLARGNSPVYLMPINDQAKADMQQVFIRREYGYRELQDESKIVEGLSRMVDNGTLLPLIRNTKVVITDAGIFSHNVRVIAGAHEGKTGIAVSRYVHAAPLKLNFENRRRKN